ncbi:MAG: VIT family protein [Ancrocorticia sp.]|nr:VIT family protein [Ancrocorticia sp.]
MPTEGAQKETPSIQSKLNWLRAGVLGANDGIVSTAGLVVGVSGAALTGNALLAAGVAGMIAGALSMAAGEYVSVSTQRDTERAALHAKRIALSEDPDGELEVLTGRIEASGVKPELARRVAVQLSARDALAAHARWDLGINPYEIVNPWHAAFASLISFILGAIIPLGAIVLSPAAIAVPLTVIAVTISLAITGSVSAHLGGAPKQRATIRNICGGLLAMGVTYIIGTAVGSFGV